MTGTVDPGTALPSYALLHGFSGSPRSWTKVIAALTPPSIAVLLPGHGGTPPPTNWAEAVSTVGAQLRGAEFVVGYSLGARIALGLLHQGWIDRAVLISVNPGLADGAQRAERLRSDKAWAGRLRRDSSEFFARWDEQAIFKSRGSRDVREELRQIRAQHDPIALAATLEATSLAVMPDLTDVLLEAADRVDVIVGSLDAKFTEIARSVRARAPALRVTVVDGGHDLPSEAPALLARAIVAATERRPTR